MLEFKVVIEKNAAKEYIKEKNSSTDISSMMVMTATDAGKIVGVGALSMTLLGATIEEVVCDDDSIEYGMGKALLNALDLGGIRNVYIKKESVFPLAKRLRFTKNEQGIYTLNLEGYFTGGCH